MGNTNMVSVRIAVITMFPVIAAQNPWCDIDDGDADYASDTSHPCNDHGGDCFAGYFCCCEDGWQGQNCDEPCHWTGYRYQDNEDDEWLPCCNRCTVCTFDEGHDYADSGCFRCK